MDKELLLIDIYCKVDDECAQPSVAHLLQRTGRKPKLSDVALVSLGLFQEFTGIKDEDEYWQYVQREHGNCFPGQWVDRSQYNRRKKNLAAVIHHIRLAVIRTLPNPSNLHIIDCIGTTAITVTKFFGSQSFP